LKHKSSRVRCAKVLERSQASELTDKQTFFVSLSPHVALVNMCVSHLHPRKATGESLLSYLHCRCHVCCATCAGERIIRRQGTDNRGGSGREREWPTVPALDLNAGTV
jgi:hypothetical protein